MEILQIIILAMIAGFIFLRLRSVLGSRPEDEPSAPPAVNGPLSRRRDQPVERAGAESDPSTVVPLEADPSVRKGYRAIRQADSNFDPEAFARGAEGAYRLILEAFWAGDKDGLRPFVADDVYDQFAAAIDDRVQAGHQVRNKIVDITHTQVVAADLQDKIAELDVKLQSEIVTYVVDEEGRAVEGDPSETVTVTDIWTFQRDVTSRDPNWILVATRSE